MNAPKFRSDDQLQKQFAQAVKDKVNAYFRDKGISKKGDFRMYLKAIILLALYLAPFLIILFVPMGVWPALLLVILMGIGEAGVGMSVMHDAAHGAFSEKQWVNNMFASTMFLLGSNTLNWKIQHNLLHHTYTNIYGFDQDIGTKAVIRLSSNAPLKKYQRWQYIYAFFLYGLMTLSKLVTDITQLKEFNKSGLTKERNSNPRKEMIKLILSKVIYFMVVIGLPIILTGFTWWQVLIGFCLLHITAGIIMSTIFQMAHVVDGTDYPMPDNDGVVHNEWMVHELHTTSDFARNNILLNWYVGGLNFQIEHHFFQNVCHIHYSRLAPIVQKTAEEFGYPYNLKPSFRAAFLSHVHRLKVLGR